MNIGYRKFRKYIYQTTGVYLAEKKEKVLKVKVDKFIKQNNIKNNKQLYDILINNLDIKIKESFIDTITTHKTNFYREKVHFDFLKNNISKILNKNELILKNNEIRVWCAACSTGEEAYTLAIVLNELLKDMRVNIKILATDISAGVLKQAMNGAYPNMIRRDIPDYELNMYFNKNIDNYHVSSKLKNMITFRKFNLMDTFPFKKKFDIIFCRNVMIYFNNESRIELINKFENAVNPRGLVFFGLTEPILYNYDTALKKVGNSIYINNIR